MCYIPRLHYSIWRCMLAYGCEGASWHLMPYVLLEHDQTPFLRGMDI